MRLLLNLVPVVLLSFTLLLVAGWSWMDWKFTSVLPYTIVTVSAFITSLSWRVTQQANLRKTGGGLFLLTLLIGLLFLTDVLSIRVLWIPLVCAVFASIHLYLFAIAAGSGVFDGKRRLLLVLPVVGNGLLTIGFFLFDANLQWVWTGFFLAVLLALAGNLLGYRENAKKA